MRYAHYRQLGLFIGSGAVEVGAGCRAVIAAHRKLSGMRWSGNDAASTITLRCQHASAAGDTTRNRLHPHPAAA